MRGSFSICQASDGSIRFYFEDEASSSRFLVATTTPENLGLAITGKSELPCDFELRPDLVGKIREHKRELVPRPDDATESSMKVALAPFEVDGWRGHLPDLTNGHKTRRVDGERFQEVLFVRYVESPQEEGVK